MKYSVSAESVLHNSQVKIQKYNFDQKRKAKIIKLPVFFHLKKINKKLVTDDFFYVSHLICFKASRSSHLSMSFTNCS